MVTHEPSTSHAASTRHEAPGPDAESTPTADSHAVFAHHDPRRQGP
ncbi:hypothetical protein [Halobacterium jilantaiense]|nr:hypothetical protein [Halobacterium jilantaiense]